MARRSIRSPNPATDLGPAGWDADYGWGLLQADDALLAVIFGDGFESGSTGAWIQGP